MGGTGFGENWVLIWWARPMLRKSLIQFSADRWGCVASLYFGLRANYGRGNGINRNLLQKDFCQYAASPKTVVFSAPDCHPMPQQRLLDTPGQVWINLSWGHCSFLLGPGMQKVLFVPSKSLFPQSCRSSIIKSHWPPKSNSLGVLSPFAGSPGWETCRGP